MATNKNCDKRNVTKGDLNKNRKSGYPGKRTTSDKEKSFDKVPTRTNPVEWYYPNEQLGKDSASIAYHILTGTGHNIFRDDILGLKSQYVVPGIMTIRLVDGVGYSNGPTSTINTAIRSIYSWVRHQNSGHSNYEAPDLGMYILAMSEVYARYAEVCRIYRVAMTYKWVNRYIPDTVLAALGADAADIRANLAQFRAGLNVIAAKISSLAVPNIFPVFKRRDMLYSNIYMDSDTDRGQYYIFKKANYRIFSPTAAATGGSLISHDEVELHTPVSAKLTVKQLLDHLTSILEPILSDEDMNIMSGDILKAYGRESLYVVNGVDENATCQPVYDETVLSQIENMTCLPMSVFMSADTQGNRVSTNRGVTGSSWDISQTDGYLTYRPRYHYESVGQEMGAESEYIFNCIPVNFVINSHVDNPDWKYSLEASRLMASYELSAGSINVHGGSEFVDSVSIYTHKWEKTNQRYVAAETSLPLIYRSQPVDSVGIINMAVPTGLILASAFQRHPFVYIINANKTGADDVFGNVPFGDFRVFSYVNGTDIINMNDCALLALFRTNLLS